MSREGTCGLPDFDGMKCPCVLDFRKLVEFHLRILVSFAELVAHRDVFAAEFSVPQLVAKHRILPDLVDRLSIVVSQLEPGVLPAAQYL